MTLLLFGVVAGEGDESSEGQRQREEDLSGRVQPHLRVHQQRPLQREDHMTPETPAGVHILHMCAVRLTSGVKRYRRPSVAPGNVRALTMKMVSTRYGKVAVTYTACAITTLTISVIH